MQHHQHTIIDYNNNNNNTINKRIVYPSWNEKWVENYTVLQNLRQLQKLPFIHNSLSFRSKSLIVHWKLPVSVLLIKLPNFIKIPSVIRRDDGKYAYTPRILCPRHRYYRVEWNYQTKFKNINTKATNHWLECDGKTPLWSGIKKIFLFVGSDRKPSTNTINIDESICVNRMKTAFFCLHSRHRQCFNASLLLVFFSFLSPKLFTLSMPIEIYKP